MSIRAKIFLVFVAAVVAGFGLLTYWVTGDLRSRYGEASEDLMVDTSRLLAEQLAADWDLPPEQRFAALARAMQRLKAQTFSAPIYSLVKANADIRIYVTDVAGRLLYDSQPGARIGDDYSDWRDISMTQRGRYGARTSEEVIRGPDGVPVLISVAYVAAPIRVDGILVGIITLGKPNTNIERFVDSARSKLLTAVVLASAVAIVLALLLYAWVSRPLQSLVGYANEVSAGREVPLPDLGDNEVGQVGEAIEKMRSALLDKQYVESYVQSLTHEVKSPLTAIRASAELLAGDLPAENRQAFVHAIEREVDRLSNIADRLLELATLERADRLTHIEPVSLHALCRDAVASAQPVADTKHVMLTQAYEGKELARGDPLLLRQSIDNLLRNALDFSPPESVVSVSATATERGIHIMVQDQGPGIPEFARDRIFDRFYSLPRPASGRKSTGLGLNFVREVAQLHGGSIEIESLEQGTRARLFIPWRPPL